MRVQKKQIFLTTFSLAVLLVLLQLFQVSAQVESERDKATKKFLNNVVKLKVNFSKGAPKVGFGFVVGERDQLLYVVTANHVVRHKKEPDVQTKNIEARFYSDQGDPEKAKLLDLSTENVDLALLEVPKPFPSYRWETDYFSFPQKNSRVWFIGRSQDWWVPADREAGVVYNLPNYPKSTFLVRISGVLPGTSGAPLVSKKGIIGMIIKDDPFGEHEALGIRAIKNIVTQKWKYPWGLKQGPTFKEYKNEKGFLERDYGDGIIIVYIPPDEFTMGSDEKDDEKPPHKVYLDGYWMGKTEVTLGQYKKFISEVGRTLPKWIFSPKDEHPATWVSWDDANAYCKWLSGKLGHIFKIPTEAQWEKAARGTYSQKYPWGNKEPDETLANFGINIGTTSPVGSYPQGASPYGLLDMAGNVWEWCRDWYDENYYQSSPYRNPAGPGSGAGRVLRGGDWSEHAESLRCASRENDGPSNPDIGYGFRLCHENK